MGKGVIVEHLGDAHYRVGLDIDVSYARDQLTATNLYLDEFSDKYQQATDQKTTAQEALTPINTRLNDYLKDAQAESQSAYDNMTAAYEAWLDAVENQPDPQIIAPLKEAMDTWFDGFLTTHDDYILALDGDEQAPLPVPDAMESRTHALQQLTLAMGDWLGAVGALIDPDVVNDAFDALGIALDEFEAATVAYAADPGNPTLKSAMNYYKSVYESAHSDWVTAVEDNSGDAAVQAARKAYEDALEAFDVARKKLGSLLGSGGMPPELAAIVADQERAYADYHAALQNWQSLTLIKVEKEKSRDELMSRLLPFTNNDGEPIRQTVNAWCCDATEDMAVGAEVATIEIPSERDLGVRVRPAYESRETYSAARDGKLQPSWASSPEATYWNWALHPGNARWKPNYRLGEILFIDPLTDKCTVQLDPQRNNEKSRARDGNTLDVVNPVKYQIDPDTGEQTPILPGDNVQVSDGVTTLTDVPIEYMECNAAVFEVGDHVMVEFQSRDWNQPKVIGFAENPRPCNTLGVIFTGNIETTSDTVFLRDMSSGGQPRLIHPAGGTIYLGNIDWVSSDKKTRISWDGPLGRSIAPAMSVIKLNPVFQPGFSPNDELNHYSLKQLGIKKYAGYDDYRYFLLTATRFSERIYRDGKIISSKSPNLLGSCQVLGACKLTYEGMDSNDNPVSIDYLVAVFSQPAPEGLEPQSVDDCPWIDHYFCYALMPKKGESVSEWTTFHTEWLSENKNALPPTMIYAFSESGKKFATLVPQYSENHTSGEESWFFVDDYVIVRGELEATQTGVVLSGIDVIRQTTEFSKTGTYDVSGPAWAPIFTTTANVSSQSSAIVCIDFVAENEVTLSGNLNYALSALNVNDEGAGTTSGFEEINSSASISGDHVNSYWNYESSSTIERLYDDETTTHSSSDHRLSPFYVDLRTGCAAYTYRSELRDNNGITAYSNAIIDNDTLQRASYEDYLWVEYADSMNARVPGAAYSSAAVFCSPWSWIIDSDRTPPTYAMPLTAFAQPTDRFGNYALFARFKTWPYDAVLPEGSTDQKVAFATSFDIDEAWRNHIDGFHHNEGDESATQTAAESMLTPLGRL